MSRIVYGILAGFIIGLFAFFAGNYMLKNYFFSYFISSELKQSFNKPPITIASDLVPQKLEISHSDTAYTISWHSSKPVKSALVFVKENFDFSSIQDELDNTEKALFVWVNKQPTTEHKVSIPTNIAYKYFYIIEIDGTWAIPYGQKIYTDKGASDPYSLLKTK